METFQLITTSRLHYVIILLTGIFASVFAVLFLLPKGTNQVLFFGSIIGICIWGYWLAEKYSKQTLNLSITSGHLQIDWVKLPLFSKKENKLIAWTDIDNYVYQVEKDFDLFKLTLNNGERLKFSISHDLDHQDNFHEFYRSFLSKVKALETPQEDGDSLLIKRGKTFYETPFGIGLAILLAGLVIFAIIFSVVNQHKKPIKWGKLIGSIIACSFYIQLVWAHNRKKKSSA